MIIYAFLVAACTIANTSGSRWTTLRSLVATGPIATAFSITGISIRTTKLASACILVTLVHTSGATFLSAYLTNRILAAYPIPPVAHLARIRSIAARAAAILLILTTALVSSGTSR